MPGWSTGPPFPREVGSSVGVLVLQLELTPSSATHSTRDERHETKTAWDIAAS
ncbi:MAG: hypothetical protein AAF799_25450 [Myxococcota bacterium]